MKCAPGKTFLSRFLLCNWENYFEQAFDKLTIFFAADQDLLSTKLRAGLPAHVELVKHSELRAEHLNPEILKSSTAGGLSCVLLDDQVRCITVYSKKIILILLLLINF